MRSSLGILVVLSACGGSSKPAAEPAAPEAVAPADEVDEVDEVDDEWGPEEDEHGGVRPPPGPAAELDQVSLDNGGTGSLVCDELNKRTSCLYNMSAAQMPAEAVKAWEDTVEALTEALKYDATRQAAVDACKMSLEAGKSGFESVGC